MAKKGERFVTSKIASASPQRFSVALANVNGFTMLEVMIVVAIVAILAAIALPNYSDYVKRGKIIEATSALSDLRTRYEQFYLDNRTYAGACAPILLAVGTPRAFTITCVDGANAYTGTATGVANEGMNLFVYTIDQSNTKQTLSVPPGWGNQACGWVTRKDGSCS
jgi:type IV pilus assembly protein PilE